MGEKNDLVENIFMYIDLGHSQNKEGIEMERKGVKKK